MDVYTDSAFLIISHCNVSLYVIIAASLNSFNKSLDGIGVSACIGDLRERSGIFRRPVLQAAQRPVYRRAE